MKRITYWPQFVLGLTFNWGALLGWSAMTGSLNLPVVIPLYAAGVMWTLMYDTIYALQDKKDDVIAGVKSTALLFGDNVKSWLAFFATGTVSLLTVSGIANDQSWPFFAGVAAAGLHMGWQIMTLSVNDPASAWRRFVSNRQVGWIVFGGIVLDTLRSRIIGTTDL